MSANILVLNMGMKSIRSIIFNQAGDKIATSSIPIETQLSEDFVTQNPDEWWEKARCVIQDSVSRASGVNIDYMTVTTSAACLAYVDSNGNSLGPCIMVSDKRAKKESLYMAGLDSFKKMSAKTGVSPDSYYLIPKTLWIKNNQPEIYSKIHKLLTPNDFLIYKMTGKYVIDYINAQKWYYNVQEKSYPMDLLKDVGINANLLPEVVTPGTCVGTIAENCAKELGLPKSIKVIATTYDAICSFVGSGAAEEGEASDVSGTVTVFRTATKQNLKSVNSKIQLIPFNTVGDNESFNIVGGSNNLGGGLIEWVKQCYYINEKYPYELMEKDAGESSLGAGGVIFLPYLLGERAPIWDYDARGVFFGLERMHTRKEMTRAVFESSGFIDMDMIKAIEENGVSVNTIRVSGGLARLNLISQIKADITGKEILVLSEFETTSTGAAIIALCGQGVYSSLKEACDVFAQIRMIIKPNKRNHEKYLRVYDLFKQTYASLKDLFPKRMELARSLYNNEHVKIENL